MKPSRSASASPFATLTRWGTLARIEDNAVLVWCIIDEMNAAGFNQSAHEDEASSDMGGMDVFALAWLADAVNAQMPLVWHVIGRWTDRAAKRMDEQCIAGDVVTTYKDRFSMPHALVARRAISKSTCWRSRT